MDKRFKQGITINYVPFFFDGKEIRQINTVDTEVSKYSGDYYIASILGERESAQGATPQEALTNLIALYS